jgi:nucleoid-associated protein EbfC
MKGGFGGGNKGGNFKQLIKQAQKMQDEITRKKGDLESYTAEGQTGGGAVTATVDGKHYVRTLKIAKEVIDPDQAEILEELVMTAINQAIEKVLAYSKEELMKATGGMPIPGFS